MSSLRKGNGQYGESLAWELANHNMRVKMICRKAVATSMQGQSDPLLYRSQKHKMITPSKVADKIVDTTFDENSNKYQSGESVDIG